MFNFDIYWHSLFLLYFLLYFNISYLLRLFYLDPRHITLTLAM